MCMTHNNIIKSQQKGGAGLHTDINFLLGGIAVEGPELTCTVKFNAVL